MRTFAVLGTGPSLTQAVVDLIKDHCEVIAVSDSYRLAPWADALVSHDPAWWEAHPEAQRFSGRKFCSKPFADCELLKSEGIYTGGPNSGLQGMRVAHFLGAARIVLLGFDMQGTHFFGPHPPRLKNTTEKRFLDHIAQFAKWRGCPVINCTPNSRLRCFPMADIDEALC